MDTHTGRIVGQRCEVVAMTEPRPLPNPVFPTIESRRGASPPRCIYCAWHPATQPLAFMNGRMRHEPEDKAQIDAWLEAVNAFREADAAFRRYIKEKNR